jgi:hypothetical protein
MFPLLCISYGLIFLFLPEHDLQINTHEPCKGDVYVCRSCWTHDPDHDLVDLLKCAIERISIKH